MDAPAQAVRRSASATASSEIPSAQAVTSSCTARTSSCAAWEPRQPRHELGQALGPVHLALAARLDQAVGVGEDEVAGLEMQLALGVAVALEHAQRQPVAVERADRAGPDVQRREVAGVAVAERVAREDAEEGGHEGVVRQAAEQHGVRLLEHLGGRERVPAAGLHEEAHHRAQRGGLDALAGHVAHEHGHGLAAPTGQAPYTSPPVGSFAAGA